MRLNVSRIGKTQVYRYQLVAGEEILEQTKADPNNPNQVKKVLALLSKYVRLTLTDLLSLSDLAATDAVGASKEVEGQTTSREAECTFIVRSRRQKKEDGQVCSCWEQALEVDRPDAVIEWDDITEFACLDIDYHHLEVAARLPADTLESLALSVEPEPWCFWVSHGRGLHLLYRREEGYPADELAACGGLTYKFLDPSATFEIKKETRHPRGAGPIRNRDFVGVENDGRDVLELVEQDREELPV